MSREKIEEMAKAMCGNGMANGNCAMDDEPCNLECVYGCCAERLYAAGYRKQDEAFSRPHENGGEWISVEERLPQIDKNGKGRYGGERSVRVLCVCKQRGGKTFVKEGYYEPCANGSVFWRIPGSIDSVTHWMPLPEPPKKGGGEE